MFNKLAKFTLPLVFGLFALICLPALLAKADAPPQISAVAAVVIDQASGKVLYDKDMNAEHYPASTTKVLTALLTLENMDIDDKITLPEDYVNVGETSIGLKAGARQTVEELLMALMRPLRINDGKSLYMRIPIPICSALPRVSSTPQRPAVRSIICSVSLSIRRPRGVIVRSLTAFLSAFRTLSAALPDDIYLAP